MDENPAPQPSLTTTTRTATTRTYTRRAALGLLGTGGLFVAGYKLAGGGDGGTSTASTAGATVADADTGTAIPSETGGPFPGDGSNGPDVLDQAGVVRSDITTSFGDFSGTAEGVPLDIELTVVEAGSGAPLPGAAVYLWHCTREGDYSLYSEGVTDQNFLRGVQAADDEGRLAFRSIFPPPTTAAGPTSTSRSSRARRPPPAGARPWSRRSWRSPRTSATRCTPPRATGPAWPTSTGRR